MTKLSLEEIPPKEKRSIAIHRDERVFKSFFVKNFRPLLSYAFSLTKDRLLSEDIASEVLWKIWEMEGDLLYIRNLESYLYRSVRNASITHLKSNRLVAEDVSSYSDQVVDVLSPERIYISNEQLTRIENAVDSLPTKTKMAFLLVKEERCTYKEAAEIMNISVKTVDRHIQIAIGKLWEVLKKEKK